MSRADIQDKSEDAVEPADTSPSAQANGDDERLTADLEFRQQKDAFKRIPPHVLVPYRGQFVASCNGEIVDSDDNLTELTRRFFGEHGNIPVYMTRVGEPIRITISTPLFR